MSVRLLNLLVSIGCAVSGVASAALDFEVDQRGFNPCYTSFVAKLKPGADIKDSAFEAINKALCEEGNVLERREARKNIQVVQSPKMRRAFMDNMQAKKRKREVIDATFFMAPPTAKRQRVEEVTEAPVQKRNWHARRQNAPLGQLLERQVAMDIIEEMYTPTPKFLPEKIEHNFTVKPGEVLFTVGSTPLAKKQTLRKRPALKRQRGRVLTTKPAAHRTETLFGEDFMEIDS